MKKYEIVPIVESEIVPDISLELIKGGGYNHLCSKGYRCTSVSGKDCFQFQCEAGYCYVCVGYQQVCSEDGACMRHNTY